jgi:hypothetical protein
MCLIVIELPIDDAVCYSDVLVSCTTDSRPANAPDLPYLILAMNRAVATLFGATLLRGFWRDQRSRFTQPS